MKPLCFNNNEQYIDWSILATLTKVVNGNYCQDCTPEYQQKMIHCGRCAHPETFFYMRKQTQDHGDEGEEMSGYSFISAWNLESVQNQEQAMAAHLKKKLRMLDCGALVEPPR